MEIIAGKINKAQKVVLYGVEGVGKSTFAAQFPDVLFIDTEGSTAHLDTKRLSEPTSWQMLLAEVGEIKANPTVCKTLVIDTVDWAEILCIEQICSKNRWSGIEDAGYGKGYTYLAEEFGRLLNQLSDIVDKGINVVLVAHAQIKKFEQPDELSAYDRWELMLQKKAAALVKNWSDMILFANYETIVVTDKNKKAKGQGGSKRVMYTSHTAAWDAKNRHGLADKLPFDYSHIASAIPNGSNLPSTPAPGITPVPATTSAVPAQPNPTPTQSASQPAQLVPAPTTQDAIATTQATQPATPAATQDGSPPTPDTRNVPPPEFRPVIPEHLKPLYDLMEQSDINEAQIRQVSASRGHQQFETPLENWPKDYVENWAIACWPQVRDTAKELSVTIAPESIATPFK